MPQGGLLVAEFIDLPPMIDLAAGYSHLLMTDGSRVWSLGRHGPAAHPATTAAESEPWLQPREVRLRAGLGLVGVGRARTRRRCCTHVASLPRLPLWEHCSLAGGGTVLQLASRGLEGLSARGGQHGGSRLL